MASRVAEWQPDADAAELELDQRDQGRRGVEAVGDAGEEADAVVGGLGAGVGEAGEHGRFDALAMPRDTRSELDDGFEPAASGPREPAGEELHSLFALEPEGLAQ